MKKKIIGRGRGRESERGDFAYLRIARVMERQILNGSLRVGEKMPSLRTVCQEYGVSQNTALSVYSFLENKMLIETRPRSGYFVRYSPSRMPGAPAVSRPSVSRSSVALSSGVAAYGDHEAMVGRVYSGLGKGGCLSLGLGTPANELLPIARLNKSLIQATRQLNGSGVAYDKVEGNERLRRQIARWSFSMECHLDADEIITTSGCLNALSYCMMAVVGKGDTVAMESPVSFGMLQLAQALGVKVLELPTDPLTGVDMNAYEEAFRKRRVAAVLLISNFSNPTGSCMPDDHKKHAVELAEQYNVPLIENDLNGDVYFGRQRPKSCKTFDRSGIVLWCGSVSKTLAPGYRVGWTAPGKFKDQVLRNKLYHSISGTAVTQEAIASMLETGRYESHLRKLRQVLHGNLLKYTAAVGDFFPAGTMVSRPQGGFVLWVELPGGIDTFELFDEAMGRRISFAPGRIFTLQDQYNNCLRLNYGLVWNDTIEFGLKVLGKLAKGSL